MTQTFQISTFRHKRDNSAQLAERTWDELCAAFRKPIVRAEKDGWLFSPAVFDPPLRAKVNAKQISLLVLDIDHAAQLGTIQIGLFRLKCAFIISSTHSHLRKTESNPDAEPRFRVVIPLAEPIPAVRFLSLWNNVKNLTGLNVDEAAKDESRIFYTPAIASVDSEYECYIDEGAFLDWKRLPLIDPLTHGYSLRSNQVVPVVPSGVVANGSRNQSLFKIGKRMAEANIPRSAIRAALLAENDRLCDIPLSIAEVESIAANVIKYPIGAETRVLEDSSPIPLPEPTAATPELDEELLPEAWRPWLSDISERLQCPLDYATVAALVSAASLIGNRIRIRPKQNDPWLVVPNLWGAIVGPPGVLKTPAVNEGMSFFRAIADRELERFEEQRIDAEYKANLTEVRKAELIKEMKKTRPENESDLKMRFNALKTDGPVEKRLMITDSSVEKLGEILNENPDGILVFRDELAGWLKKLESRGHEQDRAFYLEAWNGEGSFTFDRITRGKTHVKNLTLSLIGTIQPSVLESYIRGSVEGWADDGLIQRFQILVCPQASKEFRYLDEPPRGRELVRESFEQLYAMSPRDFDAKFLTPEAGGHAFLQFNEEAQEFFKSWLTDLEIALRSGKLQNTAIESHLSKYRSLMPSLALIFHLLKRVTNQSASSYVELSSAEESGAWCSYLQKHAEKLYQTVTLSEFDAPREILRKIESGEIPEPFTSRDIYSKGWRMLSKSIDVYKALEILIEYRQLRVITQPTGGRAKTVYLVNRD